MGDALVCPERLDALAASDIRLEAAKELLSTDLACKEVAKHCDFEGQAHCSYGIRRNFGVTSGSYRAQRCAVLAVQMA